MKKGKILRTCGIAVLAAAILLTAFLSVLYVYHQALLARERQTIRHIAGQYVTVSGRNMNVYTAGQGDKTLVFLPGAMTPSPVFDFKPLYSLLSGRYRIAVPEKFGYGYSDECDGERSVDIITEQDREALASLGIEGPYILVPHSASGLEAVYWAGKYPDEVEAIIGLDPAVPGQYDLMPGTHITEMEPQDAEEAVAAMKMNDLLMYRIGLIRLTMNADSALPALRSDALAEEEKEQYRALSYTRICEGSGSTMMRETICTEHALEVLLDLYNSPLPDVPTLFFVSSDEAMLSRPYGSLSNWHKVHEDYLSHITDGRIVYTDCGHYIHAEEPETVSAEMISFIESLHRRNE